MSEQKFLDKIGLSTFLEKLKTIFSPKIHSHTLSQVSGVTPSAIGAAPASHLHDDRYVNKTGFAMSNLNALTANTSFTENITPNAAAVASSPFARSLWHDHFAFLTGGHQIKDSQIMKTSDSSWENDSSVNLQYLFQQKENVVTQFLKNDQYARRFTIYSDNIAYSGILWFEIGVTYSYPFSNFEIHIESSVDGTRWNTTHKSTIAVSGNPYYLKADNISNSKYIRFTLTKKTNLTTGSVCLCCLKGLTARKGNQGLGIEYESPFDWDIYKNIYPHQNSGADLGTSIRKWRNVYADNFNGTATSATKLGSENKGSATQPIYLNAGTPTACTYTLGKSVPANAVFTDTWRGIQDNLMSDSVTDSLSAHQGKLLKGMADSNANQSKTNKDNIVALRLDVDNLKSVTYTTITESQIDAMFAK